MQREGDIPEPGAIRVDPVERKGPNKRCTLQYLV